MNNSFPNGLTVRELKELIKDWPEKDAMGEDSEVWLGWDGISNIATEVWPLNTGDIILSFSRDEQEEIKGYDNVVELAEAMGMPVVHVERLRVELGLPIDLTTPQARIAELEAANAHLSRCDRSYLDVVDNNVNLEAALKEAVNMLEQHVPAGVMRISPDYLDSLKEALQKQQSAWKKEKAK